MKRKVGVIGAGVIGLPTAVNIIENIPDVEVTLISEKFSPDTTGDGSAGWWEPYLIGDNPPLKMKRWGKATWDHLTALLRSEIGADIGIQLVAGYNLFKTFQQAPDWKDEVLGFRQVSRDELLQIFPADTGFNYGWAFTSLVTECSKYLPWLMKRFQKQGGRVQQRRVKTIGELVAEYDVVVNCTGVASYDLVNDKKVIPYKGQLIKVEPNGYIPIVFGYEPGDKDAKQYIIPRSDFVVLGGTADAGRWDTDIDPKDGSEIYKRCCKLMPSLKSAKIIGEWAGLRPGRSLVRLEREDMKFGPHTIPVVHNYGHGGSGVTLHWGCAQDATELVRECLQERQKIQSKL
ncbi:D-aspartate oxidase-like isoform X2 [Amphiura filiformis]|uniref:D-aspartate oxidase-like isoform X2 n=1 Tax=Amphiura filiformis TaxID=82378 RepID=UPI003B217101